MSEMTESGLREEAMRRLKERRGFSSHVVSYVVVNAMLVVVWAATGQGYFWPGWVLGGWGVGLILHAWNAFVQRPITAADVDREVDRLRGPSSGARA